MKNSTIALLAVAGIGGYFILKQTQQTATAVQGIAEIPLLPFKAAGQVFTGVEQQVVAGSNFVGQAAAQILSNANQVIQIPQKQIEQTANNLLTALPAAVNAFNVLNPLTMPLTAAAVTSNAIMNAFTQTNTPAPTAPMVSSSFSKSYTSSGSILINAAAKVAPNPTGAVLTAAVNKVLNPTPTGAIYSGVNQNSSKAPTKSNIGNVPLVTAPAGNKYFKF